MSKIPLGLEGMVNDNDDDLAAAPGQQTGGQPLKTRGAMSERARSLTDPKLPSKSDLAEGPVSTFSAIQPSLRGWLFLLRVFGRLPGSGAVEHSEAGVRKASGEETAGEYVSAAASVYGI